MYKKYEPIYPRLTEEDEEEPGLSNTEKPYQSEKTDSEEPGLVRIVGGLPMTNNLTPSSTAASPASSSVSMSTSSSSSSSSKAGISGHEKDVSDAISWLEDKEFDQNSFDHLKKRFFDTGRVKLNYLSGGKYGKPRTLGEIIKWRVEKGLTPREFLQFIQEKDSAQHDVSNAIACIENGDARHFRIFKEMVKAGLVTKDSMSSGSASGASRKLIDIATFHAKKDKNQQKFVDVLNGIYK